MDVYHLEGKLSQITCPIL